MCEWSSPYAQGYRCRVPSEPGSDLCIFHQEGLKDKASFKAKFYEQIDEEGDGMQRNQRFDFTGYVFPEMLTLEGNDAETSREGTAIAIPQQVDENLVLTCALLPLAVVLDGITVEGELRAIRARFERKAWLSHARLLGGAVFDWSVFRDEVRFAGCEFGSPRSEETAFNHCRFLKSAFFSQAQFKTTARFDNALFRKTTSFSRCHFSDTASFGGAHFCGRASFNYAKFIAQSVFFRAKFKNGANFFSAQFANQALFQAARFGRHISFDYAVLESANFHSARFSGTSSFRGLRVEGGATFEKARFLAHPLAKLEGDIQGGDGNADFSGSAFGGPTSFKEAVFAGDADFTGSRFARGLNLQDATFQQATCFELAEATAVQLGLGRPRITGIRLSARRCGIRMKDEKTAPSLWHLVRWTYEKGGKRAEADAAFYFERIWTWRAALCQDGVRRLGTYVLYPFELGIRWLSAYGASITRILTAWVVTILGFTAFYALVPNAIATPEGIAKGVSKLSHWLTSLHFSVTTFTTLGLGDLTPGRMLARGFVSAEAVIGGILMALTVLVIGRKFMR